MSNSSSDAARDDWLLLKAMVIALPTTASVTDSMLLEVRLALPHPVVLGGGESLHVAVDNNSGSAGSITMVNYWRTRIADVT